MVLQIEHYKDIEIIHSSYGTKSIPGFAEAIGLVHCTTGWAKLGVTGWLPKATVWTSFIGSI